MVQYEKKAIDWFITNKCNSKLCEFCYAPYEKFGTDASYEEAMSICNEIIKKGYEYVTICGGEPLLYHSIRAVIERLYQSNIKVVLNTGLVVENAYERVMELVPYIYTLSLPIEGIDGQIVSQLRGKGVFNTVKKILDTFMTLPQGELCKIKIGTVVNAININNMMDICDFICGYDKIIDVWRVYMFSPYGLGHINRDKLLIENKQFDDVAQMINNRMNKMSRVNISFRSREENVGYCMIVDSKGNFYRYNEEYIQLGVNIYDDYDSIIEKYDVKRHIEQKAWQ